MTKYQLDVIGVDAADVVRSAGGWLCDRVMAGWDVQVTLTEDGDLRALHILGLRIGERREEPVALAVAGGLGVQVQAALTRGGAEVMVWDADRLTGLEPVRYVLSSAARAFKAQALAAAGLDPSQLRPVEVFRSRRT
ncbi:MAG: hypothetical protein ACRDUB_17130 [Mycobacterium sp.]